jgi:hypothetical protein
MTLNRSFPKAAALLAAGCVLVLGAPRALADETSSGGGLLRSAQCKVDEAHVYPLPTLFTVNTRKDWGHLNVVNVQTSELFKMPLYGSYPVSANADSIPLNNIENDGATVIMAADLTGRGVSDILITRQGWSGWQVYTNGACLSQPFDGFVAGLYDKASEKVVTQIIPADTSDLVVDNNLLIAAGDFLGDGTEQVAYFRPDWDAIQVVGAKGKMSFPTDLRGIPSDLKGNRLHWLFSLENAKPGGRTRLVYHRHGVDDMLVFTSDGHGFGRSTLDAAKHWDQVNQHASPSPL